MKYSDNPIADCRFCGEKSFVPKLILRPDTPHYAQVFCPFCGRNIDWMGKPKNHEKRQKNKYTPEILGIDFCQICLRPRAMLGKNETLDVHHIHEIHDGGLDTEKNIIVVCTYCHKDIHQKRQYLYHNFKNYPEPTDNPPWE